MRNSTAVASVRTAARSTPSSLGHGFRDGWYDVLHMPDGNVGVSVGHVIGHDDSAALVQRRLRETLQECGRSGVSPARAFERLDRAVSLDDEQRATLFYAVVIPHQAGALLVYSNAGHPAPLLFRPDAGLSHLGGGRSASLGVADCERTDAAVCIPCGSLVLLGAGAGASWEDDVVRTRIARLEELLAATQSARPDLEALCGRALLAIDGEIPPGDVTLLALAVTEPDSRPPVRARRRPLAVGTP